MAESVDINLVNNEPNVDSWSLGCDIIIEEADTDIQEIRLRDIGLIGDIYTGEVPVEINPDLVNVMNLDVNVTIDGVNPNIVESQVVTYDKILKITDYSPETTNETRYAASARSVKALHAEVEGIERRVNIIEGTNVEGGLNEEMLQEYLDANKYIKEDFLEANNYIKEDYLKEKKYITEEVLGKKVEEKIGEMFYWDDDEHTIIGTDHHLYSKGEISANGLNYGSGGSVEPGGGASLLKDLLDVNIQNPNKDDVLLYNGTHWQNSKLNITEQLSSYLKIDDAKTTYATIEELNDLKERVDSIKEDEFFFKHDDNTIGTRYNLFSEGEISANGLNLGGGTSGGGGLIQNVLGKSAFGTVASEDNATTFNAYAIDSLYKRIVELEGKDVEVDLSDYYTKQQTKDVVAVALMPYIKTVDADTKYANLTAFNLLKKDFDKLNSLLSSDTSSYIDSWNDVVAFLDGYKDEDDLATVLSGMNSDISSRVKTTDFETWKTSSFSPLVERVSIFENSLSKINNHLSNVDETIVILQKQGDDHNTRLVSLESWRTATDQIISTISTQVNTNRGNIEKILGWFKEDADGNLYTDLNFYSTKEISANGLSFGNGSGSGLISSVLGATSLGETLTNDNSTVFNAYATNEIYKATQGHASRIGVLEFQVGQLTTQRTKVSVSDLLTTGKKIATITIDGVANSIYAPTASKDFNGTSSQFVKGDGSLDSTTYYHAGNLTSLPNPYSLKLGTKSYNGSAGVEITTSDIKSTLGISDWALASSRPTYTKSDVGLSNVENKSSATIRGEITSSNVTSALDYTPFNSADFTKANIKSTLQISDWALKSSLAASDVPNLPWSKITSGKPTTLSGYGITNAYTKTEVNNLVDDYLPLTGGTMSGSIITPANDNEGIIPASNNYGQIGSSSKKFYRMYASTFYGDLSGNATTADSATTAESASSVPWTGVSGRPTHLSDLTDDILDGYYLKLTGGTIAGNLTVNKNLVIGSATLAWKSSALEVNKPFYSTGEISANGLYTSSDMRFKSQLGDIALDLDTIANAPMFRFTWTNREDGRVYIGSSAQYWKAHARELVSIDDKDFHRLDYSTLGVLMGKSLATEVKELKKTVEEINRRMEYGN